MLYVVCVCSERLSDAEASRETELSALRQQTSRLNAEIQNSTQVITAYEARSSVNKRLISMQRCITVRR